MNSVPQVISKKPYQKPGLRVYGHIEALTRAVSNMSLSPDGGPAATFMDKTQ